MAIIRLLICLEIIELNFCNLNMNLRKYIIMRSNIDSKNNHIIIERNDSIESNSNEKKELYTFENNKDDEIML